MTALRLRRVFWIGAAAILVLAALVALVAVLEGDFSDTDGRILGTLASLLLAGATLVAGLALVDRDGALLGRVTVVLAPPSFALLAYAIWDFVFDGGGDSWRYGWTGALVLVASLMAVTAQLLVRAPSLRALAGAAGALGVAAAALSIFAIWDRSPGDTMGRAIAVAWILAGLCYLLAPVLQRFAAAGADESGERVLAALGDVELVATRARQGLEIRLEPDERLVLRRRA